ncbi:hypothetical protein [uncultured Subdoligranulum sp.]|uniref:hypothetical protein n=1 Tax=uncultured Subdoligranulum sp. TaxID=512298 RepID=UPI0026335B67|nr:hypothetical protein [uncultured Subdoligranulum sp.]
MRVQERCLPHRLHDIAVERGEPKIKNAQWHDLLVERKQHNLKKAQWKKALCFTAEGFSFFRRFM